jgi:hypothetical protein
MNIVREEKIPSEIQTHYRTWGNWGQHSFATFLIVKNSRIYTIPEAVEKGLVKIKEVKDQHSRKNVYFNRTYQVLDADALIRLHCYESSAKHEHDFTVYGSIDVQPNYVEREAGIVEKGFKIPSLNFTYDRNCFRGSFKV